MRTLIFATNNKHKLQEVSEMLKGIVTIRSLAEMGLEGDLPETADTLQGNALQKAQGVYERTGMDCFDDNIDKLLAALDGECNRRAAFRTVICLLEKGVPRYFEGRVDGTILTERYGKEGFGYDPVFMPDRFAVSFAEMPLEVKNRISHRGLAVGALVEYLRELRVES